MEKLILAVFLLLFFSEKVNNAEGTNSENFERKLVRKLLDDYDISVRPSINATQALNVTFGLALTQIIDVDERNQILTTNCWLNQQWIDYSLRWNPLDYGGIKVVRIPASNVWRPDIILYNNADSQYNLAILSTNVIVNSEGNLTWLSTAIFKSSCQINVEYFPFDEQSCEMKFASWTYDGFQLNLVIQTEEGDLSNYVSNGEWDLIKMQQKRHIIHYSCCVEPYPDITYYIVLRRRPLFYVFNLILPCVLISGLALLSFYMPSDSGEKVTLGITTLLSMTVFLMVIGESMPPTSEKLPLIGLYYGVTISLVSFATGLSVVTLNIHHRGMRGTELPRPVRNFIFNILARVVFIRLDLPRKEDGEDSMATTSLNYPQQRFQTRKLPVGDTWRIVYPDMPSPTTIHPFCESNPGLLESRIRTETELNDIYVPYVGPPVPPPNDKCSTCCGSRLRPIMRVRGIQSLDGSLPDSPTTAHHKHHTHHRHVKGHNSTTSLPGKPSSDHSPICPTVTTQPCGQKTSASTTATSGGGTQQLLDWERRLFAVLQRLVITMERNEVRMSEQDKKDTIKLEWQQAALILDRFLLWVFVIATIGATFGILYMSPHTKLFTT